MINPLNDLSKIIKNSLNQIIFILNIIIIGCIFTYTFLFYIGEKNFFLSNLIVIFSLITFFLKLLYWHLIKNLINSKIINGVNKSKSFFLRLTLCIFIYVTPSYYIFKQDSLVMNDNIISITLIIITTIASIGFCIERYLFFLDSNFTKSL